MDAFLVDELRRAVGTGRVLDAPASRLVYSYDAALDKGLPGAVALPETVDEAVAAVRWARRRGVPWVARGAGTNLCGASIPADGGLVLHLARLDRILSVDPAARRAVVEPGVVNLHLQRAAAISGLFYAPDPASQKACTLGGNIATNAGGPHCLKHGVTTNHVQSLQVVLPDGEVVETSVDDPGPDLTGFFVGAEGTLGVVTRATLKLLPTPPAVRTMLAAFPSLDAAGETVTEIVSAGIVPTSLEMMDRLTVEAVEAFVHAGYPLDCEAVLLIEVDGPRERTETDAARLREICRRRGSGPLREARDEREREKLWEGRRGAYPSMARLAPNVLVEDGVVPRPRLAEAVRRVRAIAERDGLRLGVIAHAGDGNLHPNMIFDERDAEETRRVKAAGYEMLKVCVDLGGSISGEHGIGTDKREAMRWLFTPATLRAFRRLKRAFDPENLCNPDKLIPVAGDPPPVPPGPPLPRSGAVRAESVAQVQGVLSRASLDRRAVWVRGRGTKGFAVPADALVLETGGLRRVVDHDHVNFTLTVEAGATLEEVRAALAPAGQHVRLEGDGSLGGLLATRRVRAGRLRDEVIGLKAVTADGQRVDFGGKVMKNVAGYDALKLFLGSWGAFGVIVEITLRLHALPLTAEPAVPPAGTGMAWTVSSVVRRVKTAFDPDNRLNPGLFADRLP